MFRTQKGLNWPFKNFYYLFELNLVTKHVHLLHFTIFSVISKFDISIINSWTLFSKFNFLTKIVLKIKKWNFFKKNLKSQFPPSKSPKINPSGRSARNKMYIKQCKNCIWNILIIYVLYPWLNCDNCWLILPCPSDKPSWPPSAAGSEAIPFIIQHLNRQINVFLRNYKSHAEK